MLQLIFENMLFRGDDLPNQAGKNKDRNDDFMATNAAILRKARESV